MIKRFLSIALSVALLLGNVSVAKADELNGIEADSVVIAETENLEEGDNFSSSPFEYEERIGDYTITLSAEKGVFPEETTVSIEKASRYTERQVKEAVEEEISADESLKNDDRDVITVEEVVTFDITFRDEDGLEIEPEDGSVDVSITLDEEMNQAIEDENTQVLVFHVDDNNNVIDQVESVDLTDGEVAFEAEEFSAYSIVIISHNIPDITSPVFKDFTISTDRVTRSAQGTAVTMTATVRDDESGVEQVYVKLANANNDSLVFFFGKKTGDTWEAETTINNSTKLGVYTVKEARALDKAANYSRYIQGDMTEELQQIALTVEDSAGALGTVVERFSFNAGEKTIKAGESEKVGIELELSDAGEEINRVSVEIKNEDTGEKAETYVDQVEKSTYIGQISLKGIDINEGNWKLCSVTIEDGDGELHSYTENSLPQQAVETVLTVYVDGSASMPRITNLYFETDQVISGDSDVTVPFTFKLAGGVSGMKSCYAYMYNAENDRFFYLDGKKISDTEFSGKIKIPKNYPDGYYGVALAVVKDNSGNETSYSCYDGTMTTELQRVHITIKSDYAYDIYFNGSGATGSMKNMTGCKANTSYVLNGNTFTKKGYSFAGWNTQADGSGKSYSDGEKVRNIIPKKGNIVLYAQWIPENYSIVYMYNGGSPSATMPSTYNVEAPVEFSNPTRSGYSFAGWYTDINFSEAKKIISTENRYENLVLYAKWVGEAYNVSFDGNGADSGSVAGLTGIKNGYAFNLPENRFTKEGYKFLGWSAASTATSATYTNCQRVRDLSEDGSDVELYAIWKIMDYSLTFNLNGGEYSGAPNPESYDLGADEITFVEPVREGYDFAGWYSDKNYRNRVEKLSAGSTGNKVYYAKWNPHKYSVKYDGNGATSGSMTDSINWYCGKLYTLSANKYSRTGYRFLGWATSVGSETVTYTNKSKVSNLETTNDEIVTLYAVWERIDYSISYVLNGGTYEGITYPDSYNVDSEVINLVNPVKSGCDFLGWFSDRTLRKRVESIDSGSTGNRTYYAKWYAHKYSVKYDGNGATSGSMSNSNNWSCGNAYTLPVNRYKRTGYLFVGWNTNALATTAEYSEKAKVSNVSTVDGNTVTLYAVWKKCDYAITYNLNGGYFATSPVESYQIDSGDVSLVDPVQPGCVFIGWYADKNFRTSVVKIPNGSTGNKVFYAKWTGNKYNIKYDGNGADKGSMANSSNWYCGKSYTLPANKFTKKDYVLAGWSKDKLATEPTYTDRAKVSNVGTQEGETVTLYAIWKDKEYSLTYYLNGGVYEPGEGNPSTYSLNTSTITFANPIKTGYDFGGWFTESSYRNRIKTIMKGSFGNRKLYAKWIANSYNIKYDGNGALSGTMTGNFNLGYDKTYTLSSNKFTRTGYTFTGWSTDSSATEPEYRNSARIKNLTTEDGVTITLYAVWKENVYTIKYNLNGGTNSESNPATYTVNSSNIYFAYPEKPGYTFYGWYLDSRLKKECQELPENSVGNVTLYARWVKNK